MSGVGISARTDFPFRMTDSEAVASGRHTSLIRKIGFAMLGKKSCFANGPRKTDTNRLQSAKCGMRHCYLGMISSPATVARACQIRKSIPSS